jgi:hypothetical protein
MAKKPTGSPQLSAATGGMTRPRRLMSLLCQGSSYVGWYRANRQKNRYYVANLEIILDELKPDYTKLGLQFQEAQRIIREETDWSEEYPSPFKCSPTQLAKPHEAKQFEIAAAIIVAMEVVAREKKPGLNVYKVLRILPAQYFVDLLDKQRLAQIQQCFEDWTVEQRVEIFGEDARDRSFVDLCLFYIDQAYSDGLLDEIVKGFCILKHTADLLEQFVNRHFPKHLHVGPVRGSGDVKTIRDTLATERAAYSLKVPRTLEEDKLGADVILD